MLCCLGIYRNLRRSKLHGLIESGGGHHAWDITTQQYEEVLKWLYASTVIYCPAAFLIKATLLLLIARVYAVERAVARATYIFIWFLLMVYTPIQILKVLICKPINSFWKQDIDGNCLPQRKIFLSDSSLAIVSDLFILVIPIVMTVRLRMSIAKKIKIMCLLGAGGVATAVTIWRLVKVIEFQTTTDPTADWVLLNILTILELSIGLVCSCLPSANLLIEQRRRPAQRVNPPYTPPQRRRLKKNKGTAPDMPELREAKVPTPWLTTFPEQGRTVTLDFDCELAFFTGSVSNNTEKAKTPDELFVTRHATSLDGQREGWLEIEALPPVVAAGQSKTTYRDMTIDREVAQMSENRPWDCIWDGSPNSRHTG